MSGVKAANQHGMAHTSIYRVWKLMRNRCNDLRNRNWGGRGIRVCARWDESFVAFHEDMGPRPDGMTLERKDNDGDYEPGNCVWATRKQQCRNKRTNRLVTINGVTRTMVEWCEIVGISRQNASNRIAYGWSPEDAVSTPLFAQPRRTNHVEGM